jgi:hypothetical protein
MVEEISERKVIAVLDYNNIVMAVFFCILFILGAILQSFFTSSLVPLVSDPPIVAYILSLATASLAIISLGSCFLLLVLWIFSFKKYVNGKVERRPKKLDTIYSICILFIVLAILQSFFSFLGTFNFSISIWEFKISVIIASLGLVSLGVFFAGLLLGNLSFKKYVEKDDNVHEEKFNMRSFTIRTLLLLTISSIPVVFLAFSWLGLIMECLLLLIPFYLCFGTEMILKLEKS